MGKIDGQVAEFLYILQEEANNLGIERINSVMILKGLLEMEYSPIYDALFFQIEPLAYPEILAECDRIIMDEVDRIENERKTNQTDDTLTAESEDQTAAASLTDQTNGEPEKKRYPTIVYTTVNGDTGKFIFEHEMGNILGVIKGSDALFGIKEFTTVFIYEMTKDVMTVLRTFGVNIQYLKQCFTSNVESSTTTEFEIPDELKSFLTCLNEKLKDEECNISGRTRECALVWQTLLKQSKRNVILIGEPGVGKTSIVEKITFDIISGKCPEEFKNTQVLSLDVNASIAGTMYRGQSEKRFADLTAFLEKTPDVILFIDEIHTIRGAGACREGEADLANAIKPILAGRNVRVIGATSSKEYEEYFSKDGAIKRRFRPIEIKEPKSTEVYPMLKKTIEFLSTYHGVTISREMVDFIILNAACFSDDETKDPDRTKDLIDLSMVAAKRSGKKEVDKVSVLTNFKYNFEQFVKMPKDYKKSIAYHEAGHCILFKCSNHMKEQKVIAVTIIPGGSFLGKNVTEKDDRYLENPTKDYYIDLIASYLAGRVAESLYTGAYSAGAYGDLHSATWVAHQVVSRFGMTNFGQNRMFFDEVNSQKVQDNVNEQIDELIQQGFERANQIIEDNKDKLEALVTMLMNKGIVGPTELAKIFDEENEVKQVAYT